MEQFMNALLEGAIHFNFRSENVELVSIEKVKKPENKKDSVVYRLQKENGNIISFQIRPINGTVAMIEPETFQDDEDLILIGKINKLMEHQTKYHFPEISLGAKLNVILHPKKYEKRIETIQQDVFPSLLQKWVEKAEKSADEKEVEPSEDEFAINVQNKDGEMLCKMLQEMKDVESWYNPKDKDHIMFINWNSKNKKDATLKFTNLLQKKGFVIYPVFIAKECIEENLLQETILQGYQRIS